MKLSLIQSVGLIARAITECVKKQGFVFSRKQELITVMLVSSQSFQFVRTSRTLLIQQCFSDLSSCCSIYPGQDFIKAEAADSLRTPVRHLVMTTCANLMYPSSSINLFITQVHTKAWYPCVLAPEVLSFPSVLSLTVSASGLWNLR